MVNNLKYSSDGCSVTVVRDDYQLTVHGRADISRGRSTLTVDSIQYTRQSDNPFNAQLFFSHDSTGTYVSKAVENGMTYAPRGEVVGLEPFIQNVSALRAIGNRDHRMLGSLERCLGVLVKPASEYADQHPEMRAVDAPNARRVA
jgi:hypothetical protein